MLAECAGLNACVGLGYVDEARGILRDMQAAGMRPDVRCYNTLLAGLARAGDLEALPALLGGMRAAQVVPSVVTYNILIDAYASAGWLQQARACASAPLYQRRDRLRARLTAGRQGSTRRARTVAALSQLCPVSCLISISFIFLFDFRSHSI